MYENIKIQMFIIHKYFQFPMSFFFDNEFILKYKNPKTLQSSAKLIDEAIYNRLISKDTFLQRIILESKWGGSMFFSWFFFMKLETWKCENGSGNVYSEVWFWFFIIIIDDANKFMMIESNQRFFRKDFF